MKTPLSGYAIAPPLSNWRGVLVLGLSLLALPLAALDFTAEGEKQLSLNNAAKAVTYLEAALAQGAPTERLLMNLGLAYQKLGQTADAQKAFRDGAALGGADQKIFLLNWGVSRFLAQDWAGAEEVYSQALTAFPDYAEARLNRANTRLNTKNWAGASDDYKAYQALAPGNPQKAKIDQVVALLDQAAAEAQAAQLAEQTRRKKDEEAKQAAAAAAEAEQQKAAAAAEAERQAAAAAAAAEKARQDEILARVRESLAGAGDDSKALSAGQSGVKSDNGDFSLEP